MNSLFKPLPLNPNPNSSSPAAMAIQSVDLCTLRYRHSSMFLRPRFPFPKALLTSKGTTAACTCACAPKGTHVPQRQRAALFTLLRYIVLLFRSIWRRLQNLLFPPKQTLTISEFVGPEYNLMHPAVEAYLATKIGHFPILTVIKSKGQKDFTIALSEDQEIKDVFKGTRYLWRSVRLVRVEKRENEEEDPIMDAIKVLESDHHSIEAVRVVKGFFRRFSHNDHPSIEALRVVKGYFRRFSHKGTRTFYVTFYHAEQEKTLKSYFPHIREFLKAKDDGAAVRVTNLSQDIHEPDLQYLFRIFGPVSRVCIAYDQKTGMSIGIGFVNFVHKGDAEKAIARLNGYDYDNLILRVEWAAPRNDENSVRVTNLSEDTREPDLQDLFSTFGLVSRVFIVYDQKTGMSRGFGFVNFVHKGDAEKAIAKLNGYGYDNLILRVEWAVRAVQQSSQDNVPQ